MKVSVIKQLLENTYADDDDLIIAWWDKSMFFVDDEEVSPEIWADVCVAVDDGEVDFGHHMNEVAYDGLCEVVALVCEEHASTTNE